MSLVETCHNLIWHRWSLTISCGAPAWWEEMVVLVEESVAD